MRKQFPLFQSHIDLAHSLWKNIVKPGDIAIDATCGNGNDTLILANLCLDNSVGTLYAIDIQEDAIRNTQKLLSEHLPKQKLERVKFSNECHSTFPKELVAQSVKIVVYNLGYLPKGNKGVTTLIATTMASIKAAMTLLQDGGIISITCYPGHSEGKEEEEALLNFTATFNPKEWSCTHHRWVNRLDSPSLLLLQKTSLR